jgi:flagellar basal-body rod protein FlgF
MIRGLYTAVSGMITQEAKQDAITNNMANVNTTGFKADNIVIKKFDDVLIQNYDKMVGGKNVQNIIGSLSMGSRIDENTTDFASGIIVSTDKSTDFAIEGRGFFSVMQTDGINNKEFYSRDGNFHINSKGFLINDNGDSILGKNLNSGKLEPIYIGKGSMKSDDKGNISVDGLAQYKIKTVDFDNYKSLIKVGNNLYEGQAPKEDTGVTVRQNSLEKSNINVINEMTNMMTVMRTFEANQKVVQAMDETLGKAVNEVGTIR